MRWWLLTGFGLAACVTARAGWRDEASTLAAEAPRCDRYSAFAPRVRAAQREATEQAPPEELLQVTRRLDDARRACGVATLQGLVALREKRGAQAAQDELEALAMDLSPRSFDALVAEVFGTLEGDLVPMVKQAKHAATVPARDRRDQADHSLLDQGSATHDREFAPAHDSMAKGAVQHDRDFTTSHDTLAKGAAQHDAEFDPTHASMAKGAAQHDADFDPTHAAMAKSAAQHDADFDPTHAAMAKGAAQHDRDFAAAHDVLAKGAAQHDADFDPTHAAMAKGAAHHDRDFDPTHATLDQQAAQHDRDFAAAHDTLARGAVAHDRDFADAKTEPASTTGGSATSPRNAQRGDAGAARAPSTTAGSGTASYPRSAEKAAEHAALVARAGTLRHAAALHDRAAALLRGLPPPAWPTAGTFVLERWYCRGDRPAAPQVPVGLELRASVRCPTAPEASAAPRAGGEPTFELERGLAKTRFDVTLDGRCGATRFTRTFHVEELSGDSAAGLADAPVRRLERELESAAHESGLACAQRLTREAEAACGTDGADALAREELFTAAALAQGAWTPCFRGWYRNRYGVEAPPVTE